MNTDMSNETTVKEEEPRPVKKRDLINKRWSATIIFSGVILLLVAFVFMRYEIVFSAVSKLLNVLRPITIGLCIALVLYRPCQMFESYFKQAQRRFPRLPASGLAVVATFLMLLIILAAIVWIIVPQFIQSVVDFADNIVVYYNNIVRFLNGEKGERILKLLTDNGFDLNKVREWLTNLTDYIPTALGTLSTWASGFIGGVADAVIGLIFSIYVLAGQKKLKRQGTRILKHYLPEKHYNRLSHYGTLTFRTFSDFIGGKIVDSFIIGVIVFIIMSIGKLEYPMMISVIIGITNIIPFVGPFIGTIPCALILLLINPIHAVAFVIIIIIVQQFDCNILTPYIVGSTVGLPAIWVLFAITVGGGLFGVMGMLLAVPVMSVIYAVIREKTGGTAAGTSNKPPKNKQLRQLLRKAGDRLRRADFRKGKEKSTAETSHASDEEEA